MHTGMHVQCSFTAHLWPSLLLDGQLSSEDPGLSVPHVGSQVIVHLLDYKLFLDSRLYEGSHRDMPVRFFLPPSSNFGIKYYFPPLFL